MQPRLTPQEASTVAAELNHLLWTEDTPDISDMVPEHIAKHADVPAGNMQCKAHSFICGAIFARRGATVTTRGGIAWAVGPDKPAPFTVARHWWIATEHGLIDLSIRLFDFAKSRPIVFENADLNGHWAVVASHDYDGLKRRTERAQKNGDRVLYYYNHVKQSAPRAAFEGDFEKAFGASENVAPVTYGAIVRHCERLLTGGPSLREVSQREAWEKLSRE